MMDKRKQESVESVQKGKKLKEGGKRRKEEERAAKKGVLLF